MLRSVEGPTKGGSVLPRSKTAAGAGPSGPCPWCNCQGHDTHPPPGWFGVQARETLRNRAKSKAAFWIMGVLALGLAVNTYLLIELSQTDMEHEVLRND